MPTQDLPALVTQLKYWKNNRYKLLPSELSAFINIKNEYMHKGILLSDSVLDQSVPDIIAFIESRTQTTHPSLPPAQFTAEDAVSVDDSLFDKERTQIRKHLFDNDILVEVLHSGRLFTVQWNSKLTVCKIKIPTTWGVSIDHSLLLDVYSKVFGDAPVAVPQETTKLTPLGHIVNDLLARHTDYSKIKKIIDVELTEQKELLNYYDEKKLNTLTHHGLDKHTAGLLLAFHELNRLKIYSPVMIQTLLGFRNRLKNALKLI